ncbi:hypothetical protein [Vombatid gammaherpesvirus 1]|uniref:Uncharacterized protein n=1 Tax=Vombatid gammaherpesvirus 1 TaxID=2052651 RepID=A0A3Q8J5Z4_9GAMA|nr:hypothetical protein KM710_gp29 [Vombatid gammaherpesvirus 1]AZB49134.1 hypothetical protein [Vombatid gammaherpesvirus 1]
MNNRMLLAQHLMVEVNKRISVSTHDRFGPEHGLFAIQYGSTSDSIRRLEHITNASLIHKIYETASSSHNAAVDELATLSRIHPKLFTDTEKLRDKIEDRLDEIREYADPGLSSDLPERREYCCSSNDVTDTIASWRLESLPRPASDEPSDTHPASDHHSHGHSNHPGSVHPD